MPHRAHERYGAMKCIEDATYRLLRQEGIMHEGTTITQLENLVGTALPSSADLDEVCANPGEHVAVVKIAPINASMTERAIALKEHDKKLCGLRKSIVQTAKRIRTLQKLREAIIQLIGEQKYGSDAELRSYSLELGTHSQDLRLATATLDHLLAELEKEEGNA